MRQELCARCESYENTKDSKTWDTKHKLPQHNLVSAVIDV